MICHAVIQHKIYTGFSRFQAGYFEHFRVAIQPVPRPLPGFEQDQVETLRLTLSGEPALLYLTAEERARMSVKKLSEERGELTPDLERKLVRAAPSKDRQAVTKTLAVYRRQRPTSPAQQGVPFRVPQLCL